MIQLKKTYTFLKPWLGAILVVLILQFTGLLSSISYLAQSAVLKTGLRDVNTDETVKDEKFDYNFTIKDLNGNKIDFNEFKGKVIFLNIWATWCGPCRAEMPTIQRLYDKIPTGENIIFIMLSLDRDKDLAKVIKYVKDKNYSFPAYMPSGYLTEQLNVPSIPTTFVISKEGKILVKEVGTTNFDTRKFHQFLISESAR